MLGVDAAGWRGTRTLIITLLVHWTILLVHSLVHLTIHCSIHLVHWFMHSSNCPFIWSIAPFIGPFIGPLLHSFGPLTPTTVYTPPSYLDNCLCRASRRRCTDRFRPRSYNPRLSRLLSSRANKRLTRGTTLLAGRSVGRSTAGMSACV